MKTYQCAVCKAIWNADDEISECHSCKTNHSSILLAEQHSLRLHLTRKADTIILECKSDQKRKRFEWDSSPPREKLQETISQMLREWLAEGFDGA